MDYSYLGNSQSAPPASSAVTDQVMAAINQARANSTMIPGLGYIPNSRLQTGASGSWIGAPDPAAATAPDPTAAPPAAAAPAAPPQYSMAQALGNPSGTSPFLANLTSGLGALAGQNANTGMAGTNPGIDANPNRSAIGGGPSPYSFMGDAIAGPSAPAGYVPSAGTAQMAQAAGPAFSPMLGSQAPGAQPQPIGSLGSMYTPTTGMAPRSLGPRHLSHRPVGQFPMRF